MLTPEQTVPGVLLDTHAWLWLISGNRRLSTHARQACEQAADCAQLWVSAISVWEIGMLVNKGRIQLACDPLSWIERALELPGISLVPLAPDIAIAASALPDAPPGDPADRILIATARKLGATLL